jgi:hypothetical protein
MQGYDPYFSIGDAVAALGIFLLIPQFLKPIYMFRLRVIGVGLRTLYAVSVVGYFFVIMSAVVWQAGGLFPAAISHPLPWEIVGGILFSVSYGVLGWVYIFPPRASVYSIDNYVRAGANFLAGATDEDRVEFAADIVVNIKRLIRIADMGKTAEPPAATPVTSERRKGARAYAAHSESFLRVLSDPAFCKTLVEKLPWDGARILGSFSQEQPMAAVGKAFVREIARNTLLIGEAGSAKAVDWHSFTDAPALSSAAFGDAYLNRHYAPWEGLARADFGEPTPEFMDRFRQAAQLTIDEHVKARFSYQSYNIAGMQECFEIMSRRIAALKKDGQDVSNLSGMFGRTVKYVVGATRKYFENLPEGTLRAHYYDEDAGRDATSLNSLSELIISVLENTAHDFAGYDDPFWPMCRDIWDSILPQFGDLPAGMDPLQQRFVIKLIEKTKENYEGWYSPLSRQALAIIGPHAAKGETKKHTAFKICRDLFYRELKELPAFYERDPERAATFLPNNVRYEADTKTLIHRYSFGGEDRTALEEIKIPEISMAIDDLIESEAKSD